MKRPKRSLIWLLITPRADRAKLSVRTRRQERTPRKQRFRPLFNQEGRAVSGIDPEPAVFTGWPELHSKRLRNKGSKTLYI